MDSVTTESGIPAEVVTFQTPGIANYTPATPQAVIAELEQAEFDGSTFQSWKEERKHITRAFFDSSKATLQLQTVPLCGHKFRPGHEPKNRNCERCWFTFFNAHGELTKACDEVFQQFGPDGLSQLRGPKFTRNYLKFMSTLAAWKKAADEAQAIQAEAGEPQPAV
jgi:hypothetical protein